MDDNTNFRNKLATAYLNSLADADSKGLLREPHDLGVSWLDLFPQLVPEVAESPRAPAAPTSELSDQAIANILARIGDADTFKDLATVQPVNSDSAGMSLAQLRNFVKLSEDLPGDTPVLYQRIEDAYFQKHGWSVNLLPWEGAPASPQFLEWLAEQPDHVSREYVVVEYKGRTYVRELSQYIRAWGIYTVKAEDGQPVVCIHAHY